MKRCHGSWVRSQRRFLSGPSPLTPRPWLQGFTLVEILVALVVMAFVVTAFLAVNSEGLAKTGRSRQISICVDLARAKLAEAALAPVPSQEEETGWLSFTDRDGREIENGYRWRKTVRELPFVPPESADPIAGYRAWEVAVAVAPAEELTPERTLTVTRWLDVPPAPPGGGTGQ